MKTKSIIIILISFLLGSCVQNKKPFKPALERVLLELKDSLKDEIGKNKLLSIEFYNSDRYERRCTMKIFLSDCYASAAIDGYAKIGNTTIAIYNLKDDLYETVNKNAITFFTDTVVGYRDVFGWRLPVKQFFYSIFKDDSIKRISFDGDFPGFMPVRKTRCPIGATFTYPKKYWFYLDSIQAEKDLKYYEKEVEYYRNRGKIRTHAGK
jgi:hypothetical protein